MVRCRKKQREAREVKEERNSTTAKNWNMLYTTSESKHTNTSPAKGKEHKLRINNKLAVHTGVLCVNVLWGEFFSFFPENL